MATPANPITSADVIAEMKASFTEVNAKINALGNHIEAIRRLIWMLLAPAIFGLLYMVVTGR